MKLRNILFIGRRENIETNKCYNIYKGTRIGRSTDHYFYFYRGKRMFIKDADYFKNYKKIQD